VRRRLQRRKRLVICFIVLGFVRSSVRGGIVMPEQTPLEFEREKWLSEHELRKRELEIKEREQSRSRWSNPLVLAVLAAAIAALGNAVTIWMNGREQRALEATRAEQARALEESKAEAARILEVIRTGNDADKAAVNLKFLRSASSPTLIVGEIFKAIWLASPPEQAPRFLLNVPVRSASMGSHGKSKK
jgi:hypothetical protein